MPTALITGASSGFGEEFARQLARRKFDLVLTARRKDRLEIVAADAKRLGASNATVIAADLGTPGAPRDIQRQLSDAKIAVDYLVNNAGFGTRGRFDRLPLEREIEQVNLNVTALVALTGLFVPDMVARGGGTIINVASTAAFQPVP
ncbi:MAG: SDR family NAD(P)-dependent oxidoreductase, partial [Candidatus Binataceae bacterium]